MIGIKMMMEKQQALLIELVVALKTIEAYHVRRCKTSRHKESESHTLIIVRNALAKVREFDESLKS